MKNYQGGNWNVVFVGSPGAPESHCSNTSGHPYSTIASAPAIAEKPYIVMGLDGKYLLMKPRIEFNKVGITPNWLNADTIDFEHVFVASETDSAATISAKIEAGNHIVLQPGQYHLDDSIKVNRHDVIILGLGMATLISTNGKACIEVGNVDGVRIAGILLQAGEIETPALLQFGVWKSGYAGNAQNPGVLSDVFARVGGTNGSKGNLTAKNMVQIDSGNVIVDDTWLWRADQGVDSTKVYNSQNPVQTGLVVNGDDVTGYGLASEHTLGDLVYWGGNRGKVFFYQSEYPYDVTQQNYGDKGFVSFKIADNVDTMQTYGVGAYSFWRDNTVFVENGSQYPKKPGVQMTNTFTVFLGKIGIGGIKHVVDGLGGEVDGQSHL